MVNGACEAVYHQPVYRWGQETSNHLNEREMPDHVRSLRDWLLSHRESVAESVATDSYLCPKLPDAMIHKALQLCEECDFVCYGYRGTVLRRAPKIGFHLLGAADLNHCLIIRYSGPEHFAPPHHDKQEGVPGPGAKDIKGGPTLCR